jgi:hypothetical protein
VKPIDPKKQARTVVSERLRLFFGQLKQHNSGTDELWKRVEAKLNDDQKHPWEVARHY